MNQETREVLEASIKHWEENRDNPDPMSISTGPGACALCKMFYDKDCEGCPVALRTGQTCCCGSPYAAADWAKNDWMFGTNTREKFQNAAQAEVDFLKSLRPVEVEG